MNQLKYLAYCRKSSEEDTKQIQSIDTQKRILRDYVVGHDLQLVDLMEEKKSAKDDGERLVFQQLIQRFKLGEANALLVAHIDRIARNEIEAGEVIKLLGNGVIQEIRTPSNTYASVNDLLHLGIEFLFAAEYSRRLSIRVKEGIQSKLLKGEYPKQAPIGYINKDGKIYPDPISSPLIQLLFEEFSTGQYSLKQITKLMYEQGLRTKQAGNKVVKSAIHRRLKDPVYYGMIRYNDQLYSGTHTPIISKALFDRVQVVLTGKARPKKQRHEFLYRGYLTCEMCGCMLTASIKKGRYVYYYCTNGKGHCFQGRDYLTESGVQELLQGRFTSFALPETLAQASLQLYGEDLQRQTSSVETVRDSLAKEMESIGNKLSRLEDMLLDQRISEDRYDEKRKKLLNQEQTLTSQMKHIKPVNPETTLEQLERIKYQAVHLGEMFADGDDEVRSDLLKSVLWNCTIEDKQIINTRYKKPFLYLEGLAKEPDIEVWRRRWDSNPRNP